MQDREAQLLFSSQYQDSDFFILLDKVRQISSKGEITIDITQLTIISDILWAIAVAIIRSSIIFLYIRILPSRSFRLACYAILTLNVVFSIGVVAVNFLELTCLSENSKICNFSLNEQRFRVFQAGLNLTLDVMVVFLPTPMLWGLQMPVRKKVLLSGMFGLGIS